MPATGSKSDARRQLLEVLGPVVLANGFDLEDVTVHAAGRRSVVRLVVDSDDGVDLDDVAALSRAVSEVLDSDPATDLFGDAYTLEVSSPGIDRPLTEPRHWRRAAGRLVSVSVGGALLTARVVSADEYAVNLVVEGDTQSLAFAELGPGRVQVEFNRPSAIDDVSDDDESDEDDAHSAVHETAEA